MAGALERRGVELRRQTAVRRLGRGGPDGRTWAIETDGPAFGADGVVVAVPGRAASELLRPHEPALADALGAVGYASVAIVTLRFADGAVDRPLDGTGFLVPRGEGGDHDPLVTACTWLTSKWPELARSGDLVVRASAGRAGDDRFASMADDALVAACVTELTPMMAIRRPPVEAVVTRWPGAFPQYAVGHLERVAAIEAAAARLPSTAVAGAALHGVGIPACIGSGRRAARAIVDVIGSRAHPAS
jgi:oxygen-dependent protoporphyrinogen oxidase